MSFFDFYLDSKEKAPHVNAAYAEGRSTVVTPQGEEFKIMPPVAGTLDSYAAQCRDFASKQNVPVIAVYGDDRLPVTVIFPDGAVFKIDNLSERTAKKAVEAFELAIDQMIAKKTEFSYGNSVEIEGGKEGKSVDVQIGFTRN